MYNIDIFDSEVLIGIAEEIVPTQTWFKDRYFPHTDEDIYSNDKVLLEFRDGDRQMTPFVTEHSEGIAVGRRGYTIREYKPPMLKPTRILTLDDLKKRGFGEALYRGSKPEERARKLIVSDMSDLDRRITRREEKMCVELLIDNKLTIVEYTDDMTHPVVTDGLAYYDADEGNTAEYTIAAAWDDDGGNYGGDIAAMCDDLAMRGLLASDLVIGSEVAQFILDDPKVRELLNNRRIEIGHIEPHVTHPGVSYLGHLVFDGYSLDIFVNRETYVDENGVTQFYFPQNAALVTAPGCGHMMYAQVTQMYEEDKQIRDVAQPRVARLLHNVNASTRKLELTSRPLPAPRTKAPYLIAKNVVNAA
jgi:hypothetical protein